MNFNSDKSTPNDDFDLSKSWLEALRKNSAKCEGSPTECTDDLVLASARATLAEIRRNKKHRWKHWSSLAAAACFAIGMFLVFSFHNNSEHKPDESNVDSYALILREVSAVFPHQINAIVAGDDGSQLKIILSEKPLSEDGQPVLVEICQKGNCTKVITYVGQTIQLGDHQFSVLGSDRGSIVIKNLDSKSNNENFHRTNFNINVKTLQV